MLEPHRIRTFVAIQLPEAVRDSLTRVQSELKSGLPVRSAAWTRPENLHLTLRFLGGVARARLAELRERLCEALTGLAPMDLSCAGLGAFPGPRAPRVVWVGVLDGSQTLVELAQRVNLATAEFAEQPPEARFVGHVTLLRLRQIPRPEAQRFAALIEGAVRREFGRWTCREVELVQSELSPEGSHYTTLDVFPLSR